MKKLLANRKWLPVWWIGVAAVILAVDFLAGPEIAITYLFLIPVALVARFNGRWLGIAFAVVLPLSRFCFHFIWKSSWDLSDILLNVLIRIAVLVAAAILIDRVTRQAREIRVLKGFLPICSFCKKIRTADQKWQTMETYVTEHTEARFTHTFCPECEKKHYGEFLDGRPGDSEAAPK
jgi:K+-sensing histidine kinase KdpD